MTPMYSDFETYWNREGIRLLVDGKIPNLEARCKHAFEAGQADGREEFNLPPGAYVAAIEIINEEEVE